MDPFLEEYKKDLERLRSSVLLVDEIKALASIDTSQIDRSPEEIIRKLMEVVDQSRECQSGLVILVGTTVLYLGGRFENFVKSEFEFLCRRIAKRCKYYKDLPKDMRENIIKFTATVAGSPRRYGHGDQGIRSFLKNLSRILEEETELNER